MDPHDNRFYREKITNVRQPRPGNNHFHHPVDLRGSLTLTDKSDRQDGDGLHEAFIAGANAVHQEWIRSHADGEGPPRGEPDFAEAAGDYASAAPPKPAPDAVEAEIVRLIDVLRSDEGDSVTILCDNPDFNGQPNCAIECCGDWTGWLHKRFAADSLLDTLSIAVTERKLPSPREVIAKSNGHHWVKRFNLICCRDCGFIRRADDQNKPCKGPVGVGIRKDLSALATPVPSPDGAGVVVDQILHQFENDDRTMYPDYEVILAIEKIQSALLSLPPAVAAEPVATPAAHWRVEGQPDPHGTVYDCERAMLALGHLSDDQIANNVFLDPNIVNLTAAKERIRWLSRKLYASPAVMGDREEIDAVADAIDAARYQHPEHPRARPRPFAEADTSDREYAIRLAKAAILSLPVQSGEVITKEAAEAATKRAT